MITNGEHRISKVIAIMPDGNSRRSLRLLRELMTQLMPEDYRNIEIMIDYSAGKVKNARGAYPGMVDMIQINDLKFSYPDGSAALRGVSFR